MNFVESEKGAPNGHDDESRDESSADSLSRRVVDKHLKYLLEDGMLAINAECVVIEHPGEVSRIVRKVVDDPEHTSVCLAADGVRSDPILADRLLDVCAIQPLQSELNGVMNGSTSADLVPAAIEAYEHGDKTLGRIDRSFLHRRAA